MLFKHTQEKITEYPEEMSSLEIIWYTCRPKMQVMQLRAIYIYCGVQC